MPVQRRSIDDDQVVQTLTANRADYPLDVRTLLRHVAESIGLSGFSEGSSGQSN
jgi:hypothetical protein